MKKEKKRPPQKKQPVPLHSLRYPFQDSQGAEDKEE
jgi:hypothetical protein